MIKHFIKIFLWKMFLPTGWYEVTHRTEGKLRLFWDGYQWRHRADKNPVRDRHLRFFVRRIRRQQ